MRLACSEHLSTGIISPGKDPRISVECARWYLGRRGPSPVARVVEQAPGASRSIRASLFGFVFPDHRTSQIRQQKVMAARDPGSRESVLVST